MLRLTQSRYYDPADVVTEKLSDREAAIEMIDLCKTFGRKKRAQMVVDHLSLKVQQGEILACWDQMAPARQPR